MMTLGAIAGHPGCIVSSYTTPKIRCHPTSSYTTPGLESFHQVGRKKPQKAWDRSSLFQGRGHVDNTVRPARVTYPSRSGMHSHIEWEDFLQVQFSTIAFRLIQPVPGHSDVCSMYSILYEAHRSRILSTDPDEAFSVI